MSDDDIEERPANSIAELDIHLRYVRRDMRRVLDVVAEVRALAARVDALQKVVDSRPQESSFWRTVSQITRLGAAAVVIVTLVGAVVTLVHGWDTLAAIARKTP